MLRRILNLIACSFLLSGCLSNTPKPISASPTDTLSKPSPFPTQELHPTVTPENPYPVSLPTVYPAPAYPIDTSVPQEGFAYPAPFSTLSPVPPASPFFDCGRTPGIAGCDTSAPRLAGHTAFFDVAKNLLIGLDLRTGQGWSVPISKPRMLEWSPDGSQLLVSMNFPQDQTDNYEYLVFGKEGQLIQQFTGDQYVVWQQQGAILRGYDEQEIFRSPEGGEAWLEGSIDGRTLHYRPSGNADWKTAALDVRPMEWPTELYGWIPGTSQILITQSPGSVASSVTLGHVFYSFNIQTGELRYLKDFRTRLDPQFITVRESYLAIIQLGYGLTDDTLAIFDGKTGDISRPLPRIQSAIQPYSIQQIAWQPGKRDDEGLFVMMVKLIPNDQPNQPPVSPLFPKDGLYFYNWTSGEGKILHETPENMLGGNFHWTADGQYLLYSLGPTNSKNNAQTSLYVRQISTGTEWVLLDRLVNPDVWISYITWPLVAIYME